MPKSKPHAAPLEPFAPEEQRRRWRLIAEAILNDGRTDQAEKEPSEEKQKAA